MSNIVEKLKNIIIEKNQRGLVLVIVMAFMALMLLSTVSLSIMIQRDIRLIRSIKEKEQARYAAEAGVAHALAAIKNEGFASRADFSDTLDTATYSVTFSETGGRHLVTSVGTVSGISKTVTAEVADNTPTALNYFSGAGNDIKINSLVANATIVGSIHANNDVYLKSGPIIAHLWVTGTVSATGIVKEGSRLHQTDGFWGAYLDTHVYINDVNKDNAVVFEGVSRITFPTFDYASYEQAAIDSGDFYSGDQVFSSETLTPGDGIVYVDGDAEFRGPCGINGGIIADNIRVIGTLSQYKAGNRNVILAKTGDVRIFGRLYTQEALVYAAQDIASLQILAEIEVNGIMLARRDITMWNFITTINYNYVYITPSDMMDENGEAPFKLISWNR